MRLEVKKLGAPRKYDRISLCFRCGKVYERYPGKQKNERTFCSRKCYNAQMGEENILKRVNQIGGITFLERKKLSESKKGKHNGRTYEKTFGKHTHRTVMEKIIDRPLAENEVVHHIDGNPRNNKPENLMLFSSQAEHLAWHKKYDSRFGGE